MLYLVKPHTLALYFLATCTTLNNPFDWLAAIALTTSQDKVDSEPEIQ
jgi:hypothetical protein